MIKYILKLIAINLKKRAEQIISSIDQYIIAELSIFELKKASGVSEK